MTQANEKWWDSSIYTYVDVDYDGESESVSTGYHIESIVVEAERRGYERAMEEVKGKLMEKLPDFCAFGPDAYEAYVQLLGKVESLRRTEGKEEPADCSVCRST